MAFWCSAPPGMYFLNSSAICLEFLNFSEKFFKDFHEAGVNSVLIADLSIDDADEITGPAASAGLDTVFMATPVTTAERMKLVASKTTGFIYTVSVLGVTGSREKLSGTVEGLVGKIKEKSIFVYW